VVQEQLTSPEGADIRRICRLEAARSSSLGQGYVVVILLLNRGTGGCAKRTLQTFIDAFGARGGLTNRARDQNIFQAAGA
jgi:hypothetical protein